jgi:hypothetical protein
MKEVTVKIPSNKYDFFMELVKQLGIDVAEEFEVPEEHIAIVRERVNTTKPEKIIPWTEARKQLTFKDK